MAPKERTPHPDEEDPILSEIVVAGDNSRPTRAKVPSLTSDLADTASKSVSKQLTDKSSKPVGLQEQQQDPKESQPEVQEVDDPVDVSGKKSKRRGTTASETQRPWSGPAKPKRRYCPECTKRKSERGDDAHPRQNAIHGCAACAELTKQASNQPEPPRRKSKAGESARPEPKRRYCPECTKRKKESGDNGHDRKNAIYKCAACIKLTKQASNQPEQSRGKSKAGESAQPEPQDTPAAGQDHGSEPSTEPDDPNSPPVPNADNSLVDDVFGSISADFYDDQDQGVYLNGAHAPAPAPAHRPEPVLPELDRPPRLEPPVETVNPARLTTASPQGAGEPYPDPEGFEVSPMPTHFADAMVDLERSRDIEASMASRSTGASSSPDVSEVVPSSSDTFQASPPAPYKSLSIPPAANQAPANLSSDQDHSGVEPSLIDPRLWEEFTTILD